MKYFLSFLLVLAFIGCSGGEANYSLADVGLDENGSIIVVDNNGTTPPDNNTTTPPDNNVTYPLGSFENPYVITTQYSEGHLDTNFFLLVEDFSGTKEICIEDEDLQNNIIKIIVKDTNVTIVERYINGYNYINMSDYVSTFGSDDYIIELIPIVPQTYMKLNIDC